jgi:hypothetical protein
MAAVDAAARAKTDMVELANGDRVSGEIKSMRNGILSYGTDSMGTVSIEWDGVNTLDSNHFFRLRMVNQVRLFGALGESETPGYVQIVHSEGVEDIAVQDIVAITAIESSLAERLDSVINLGYSDFKANQSRTSELGMRVTYEDEYSLNRLDLRSVVAESESETNTSNRFDLSREHLWQNPLYFNYYRVGWESNDQLAIDSRYVGTYGIGRRIFDDNRTKLRVVGGLQAVREEDSLGETTDSIEGLLAVDYRTWSFSSPELELVTGVRLYPGLTESGRIRGDGDISLSWEVTGDIDLTLSAFGSYDNETNQDGDDYDYGITTGISWEL